MMICTRGLFKKGVMDYCRHRLLRMQRVKLGRNRSISKKCEINDMIKYIGLFVFDADNN